MVRKSLLILSCLIAGLGIAALLGAAHRRAASAQAPALQILGVHANADTVGLYEKFELTFEVTGTVATNPSFPYDPSPPPGAPAGVGISVDGLFSPDNWTTVITQPGFLYQDYQRQCIGDTEANDCRDGQEWLYPLAAPAWKVRFAPRQTGTWRYRIRVTDASGAVQSDEGTFTVVPSGDPLNHGFIRISPADPGYFEYADGTPFIGVGHGSGFDRTRFTYAVDEEMRRFAAARVNFLRIWMSGDSVYMAPWSPWHSHHLPGEGGYLNAASLTYTVSYADHLFSLRLWDYDDPGVGNRRNPCMFQGFANNVAVKPNTTYQLSVRVRTQGVTGPRDAAYPYGFTVRKGGWLGESCSDPAATAGDSTRLLGPVIGTAGWQVVTATFTTGPNEYFLGNLYLILENTTGGDAFVDEVSLREAVGGAPAGPEVLRKNRFAYQQYFDQQPSWQWDYVFERAAQSGVTIRPVVLEKNDWIANHMDAGGNRVGAYYDLDNDRFYAAPNTAVRRYHEYFWRYLIARWGYSRAVHSWELLNEGDPYNGNHYAMADAFGRFMDAHDPHGHLVTTSNWHSFPVAEFWGNPAYAGVDYADIHAYACCGIRYAGWAQEIGPPLSFESRSAYVYGGIGHSVHISGTTQFNNAGPTPRSLAIRGQGEWIIRYRMKAENWTGACDYGIPDTLSGPRLMWVLDDTTSNVVPPAASGQEFVCSAPAGTYDWRTFESRYTHDGQEAPLAARLILTDDAIHSLSIHFQNGFGTGGEAWIDHVELIGPDGRQVYLNGDFDLTVIYNDAAHLTSSYSLGLGGRALSGPSKPVTRGEVGIGDLDDYRGDANHDQANDTQGVWLHNFLWAQVNPGGLYELYWDPDNIRRHDLYDHFKAFRDFMDGIPLNNGRYEDARAVASDPDLRVLGQMDRTASCGHLWIQNRNHTWRNVVDGVAISPLSGAITVPQVISGTYRLTWWDTISGTVFLTQTLATAGDSLTFSLPAPLTTDVAVKVERVSDSNHAIYLPLVLKAQTTLDKWALWTNGARLRGANIWQRIRVPSLDQDYLGNDYIGPPYSQADFNRLAELGANYVNLSIPGLFTERPPYQLDEQARDHLDQLLEQARQADLFVTIAFRTGPGRSDFTFYRDGAGVWYPPELLVEDVWTNQAAQDAWVDMWRYTAQRYRNHPVVVGYELMVEPNADEVALDIYNPDDFYPAYANTTYDWNRMHRPIVQAIREVDPDTPILLSGMGWGSVMWLPYLQPMSDTRTVYAVHQYMPFLYTHQQPGDNRPYPGYFDVDWDNQPDNFDWNWMANYFSRLDTFQVQHPGPQAVNEFGVVRWAPGASNFMRDQMNYFEQRGMNYAIWVWEPTWEPWRTYGDKAMNYLFGPDPNNYTEVPNALMDEILQAWSRNTIRPSHFHPPAP